MSDLMRHNDLTQIVPKRDYTDIIKMQDPDLIEDFLQEPATIVMELVTGLMAQGKMGALVTGAKLAQGALKARLFKQLSEEIRRLRDAGKIQADFAERKYGSQTWTELLTIIDTECPDADKLVALKAMFFGVNRVNATDAERILAYQLWQITKKLSSGELLVLKAVHETLPGWGAGHTSYVQWSQTIAARLGNVPVALVDVYEKSLVNSMLLSRRQFQDDSGIIAHNARFTDLGLLLCKNIETYRTDIATELKED